MKKKNLFLLLTVILLCGCSSIPNTSVFEELKTADLAKAIKSDKDFANFYEDTRELMNLASFSEVQKAQFADITYRRLYRYSQYNEDSINWIPKSEKWGQEWDETLLADLNKVDEKSEYWRKYKAENSLDRFADVRLSDFWITHYEYIGGVDDAYICFKITPKDGPIEQLKFTYSYSYKINNGLGKKTQRCIYSSPITTTKEGMWEISYSEKENFDGMTVTKFLQQYDLDIEITDVRKDGKNYSLDDLNIPEAIIEFWNEDTPENRDKVASLINPSYVNREQYIQNQKDEVLKKYDKECFDLVEALAESMIENLFKDLLD